MNRTATMCATLLALSTLGVAGAASPAGAAPGPCKGSDPRVAVTNTSMEAADANLNGFVCESTKVYHAPKKPGPPSPSTTYYDDRA